MTKKKKVPKELNDKELQYVYDCFVKLTNDLLADYNPAAIAGVMAVQSFTLYKSILSPEQFEKVMLDMYENRVNIKSYDVPVLN